MRAKENRRAPRVRHDSVLEMSDDSGRPLAGVVRLVDFSTSGARLSSTAVLAVGARLQARLRLLKEGVLDVSGRVVRVEEKGNRRLYAIKFDSVRQRPWLDR